MSLRFEHRLIVSCLRTAPDQRYIGELLGGDLDWKDVLRRTEEWGLVPPVHATLTQPAFAEAVPVAAKEHLRQVSRIETIRAGTTRDLLCRALVAFDGAGVRALVVGGAALASLVYRSPIVRRVGRIDLVAPRRDHDRIEEILAALGSTREGAARGRFVLRDLLQRPNASATGRPIGIPIDEAWARARRVELAGAPSWVLDVEDSLLHLVSEPVEVHARAHLMFARDVDAICSRSDRAFHWGQIVARARTHGLSSVLSRSLRLARDLLASDVPSDALRDLETDLPPRGRTTSADETLQALIDGDAQSQAESSATEMPVVLTSRDVDIDAAPSTRAGPRDQVATAPGDMAMTYDQRAADGLGAQLQRIYSVYAMARALGVKYVHSPVGELQYQGLMPMLKGQHDAALLARSNALFALRSDEFDLEGCERISIRLPGEADIERFRQHAAGTGRPLLLQVHEGYRYTDHHPDAYSFVRPVSPYRHARRGDTPTIAVHVRRGDAFLVDDPRLLPNSYFVGVCEAVVKALRERGELATIRVHTEAPPRRYTVHPNVPGLFIGLDAPVTLDPASLHLEDFEALPNASVVLNVPPLEALDDFATADVLITSRSCLGYVAGVINPHGLVIAPPHLPPPRNFHVALPGWLVADEQGSLDSEQLSRALAQRRSGPA